MLKTITLLILLVTPILSQTTDTSKTRDATILLDFEKEEGVPVEKQTEIQKRIRSLLDDSDLFLIQDKEAVENIIENNSEKLKTCVEIECAITIGELGNYPKAIDGKIRKEGEEYILTFQLVDVKGKNKEFSEAITFGDEDKTRDELDKFKKSLRAHVLNLPLEKSFDKKPYIWRSAVFPGWGQYHNERTKTAYLYGSIFVVLGLYHYNNYTSFIKAENAYKSVIPLPATSEQDTFGINYLMLAGPRSNYQDAGKRLNNSLYLLTLFYLWNIFDAYYYTDPNNEAGSKVGFYYNAEKSYLFNSASSIGIDRQYGISYTFRF